MATDFVARVESLSEREARSADLDSRDREHGGMRSIPEEVARETVARERRKWLGYKPSVKPSEVRRILSEQFSDPRRISIGRLQHDCNVAAKRWSKLRNKADRDLLAADACLLLLAWPEHGAGPTDEYPHATRIDLGGGRILRLAERRAAREPNQARAVCRFLKDTENLPNGTLPLRADWLDPIQRDASADGKIGYARCSVAAMRALRAAVKQASEDRTRRQLAVADQELSASETDFVSAVERERERKAETLNVPDGIAAEVVADALGLPLCAGRAIVSQCERRAYLDGSLARSWGLSEKSAQEAVARGAAIVRRQYPNPDALVDALRTLPTRWRRMTEESAILALSEYAHTGDDWDLKRAQSAITDWRSVGDVMPDSERATLAAARRACQRCGIAYGAERAERIALSAARIIPAERVRTLRGGRIRQTGDLAPTYPHWREAQRVRVSDAERERIAQTRMAIERFLESGASDADTLRALRAEISR